MTCTLHHSHSMPAGSAFGPDIKVPTLLETLRYTLGLFGVGKQTAICSHAHLIRDVVPSSLDGCVGCIDGGQEWAQLRMCLTCGFVGCCDDSSGRHSYAHFRETGHPIVRALGRGQQWMWCYVDAVNVSRNTSRS